MEAASSESAISRTTRRRAGVRLALAAVLVAGTAGLALHAGNGAELHAGVPVDTPTFSDPQQFDNAFFPFEAGAARVYEGSARGARTLVLDRYLAATRTFIVGGSDVECSAIRQTAFEHGKLSAITVSWYAEADDGTVYTFGRAVDHYADGEVVDHAGSWLVGGPLGTDPLDAETAERPSVFLPGDPEVGDELGAESARSPGPQCATVRRLGRRVRVAAGRFEDCLEVGTADTTQREWYAPGVGFIRAKGTGGRLVLDSSTFGVGK